MSRPYTPQEIAAVKAFRERHRPGPIKPVMLVDEVRGNVDHPLYSCFEWDDEVGAEMNRIEQAKQLLRVKVEYIISPTITTRVPLMITDSSPGRQGRGEYLETVEVVSNREASHFAMLGELKHVRMRIERTRQICMMTVWEEVTRRLNEIIVDIDETILELSAEYVGNAPSPPPPPRKKTAVTRPTPRKRPAPQPKKTVRKRRR